MNTNRQDLHSLLEMAIEKAVKNGESMKLTVYIPYKDLRHEYSRLKSPLEADALDVKVTITVRFADDDDEEYETDGDFAVKNKTSN